MNSLFRLSFLAGSIYLLAACNATKPLSSTMNVAKGDNFGYTVTQHTNMDISVMGQDMSTTGRQDTEYAFKVMEVAPSGDFKTDVTIERVAFQQKVPMVGDVKYDSADKEGSKNSPLKSLGETVGKRFQISYDKSGKIEKTEGVQEIIGDISKSLNKQGAEQLVSQFGTAGITNTLKNLSGIIQGSPKVGSTWSQKTEAMGMVNMILNQTYTLTERKDGQAIITVGGTAKTTEGEGALEFQGMQISYDMEGPITGTIIVDEKTGWAISSDVTPNLKGKMTLTGGPLGSMSANASMKMGISAKRK